MKKNLLIINNITSGSPAENIGIQPGDCLLSIDGHQVEDIIDYYFYSSENNFSMQFIKKNKRKAELQIQGDNDPGLSFRPLHFKKCSNKCIFCFIDQNPGGLRKSLYFKDEDFRLSFLYGNYVTLTNARQKDLDRIIKQRLSPLYLSIHAVDPKIRKQLLGIKKDDKIIDKISQLVRNKIDIHSQIVLCPGINDNDSLKKTILVLSDFYPGLKTLAIVPVGLTKYRENLPQIKEISPSYSKTIIDFIRPLQKKFKKNLGSNFVYLSDEFYLLAEETLPEEIHYEQFSQIDNGVGMTRYFINDFQRISSLFPQSLNSSRNLTFITGELAYPVLKEYIIPKINKIDGCFADICVVKNHFYGDSVTVSGLLTGRDIITACKKKDITGEILLPANCLNSDVLFIDGLTVKDISNQLNNKINIIENMEDIFDI